MSARYSLETILAAEARGKAIMAAHFAEKAAIREVDHASLPFWPLLVSVRELLWDEERRRPKRLITWPMRTPAQWRKRRKTALRMREAGASLREIGARLGITAGAVSSLIKRARRDRDQKQ
jgi:hypothetical protein